MFIYFMKNAILRAALLGTTVGLLDLKTCTGKVNFYSPEIVHRLINYLWRRRDLSLTEHQREICMISNDICSSEDCMFLI